MSTQKAPPESGVLLLIRDQQRYSTLDVPQFDRGWIRRGGEVENESQRVLGADDGRGVGRQAAPIQQIVELAFDGAMLPAPRG